MVLLLLFQVRVTSKLNYATIPIFGANNIGLIERAIGNFHENDSFRSGFDAVKSFSRYKIFFFTFYFLSRVANRGCAITGNNIPKLVAFIVVLQTKRLTFFNGYDFNGAR